MAASLLGRSKRGNYIVPSVTYYAAAQRPGSPEPAPTCCRGLPFLFERLRQIPHGLYSLKPWPAAIAASAKCFSRFKLKLASSTCLTLRRILLPGC
ncbi:hypothetical protein R1flu_012907 [Riccia fluitans]|uniref:Uncharacterized protein n=1 Tax=Riccia fluitans TaxID=41844 RepID=A0ABD1ZD15_9MARC